MVVVGDDNTTMNTMPSLKYIIENEHFIICPFLPTDQFIQYCKDRGIQISRKQLEQFEKLEIFYPIARVRYPKIKTKIEYVDNGKRYRDLGILKDGEEWSGEIKEEYAGFYLKKGYAMDWLEEGHLWNPASQPFQAWKTFKDGKGYRQTESFYSIFQCYTLYDLIQLTKIELRAEAWVSHSKEDINVTSKVLDWAEMVISSHQKNGIEGEAAVATCQIISNRYFPITQSDRRTIIVPGNEYWHKYCRDWDAKAVLDDLGMNIDELKKLHAQVAFDAKNVDPLERWYELISFVSVGQKKKLKGKALFAQTLYSMEQMLRLFYDDLTGNKLLAPDESPFWEKDKFYGEGVTKNELQYLEFLTNQYNLNPRPNLILVVEGNGEAEQFPRLAKELFRLSFPQLGIEVVNIHGVGNFTGKKSTDKYGALEKFIDDYHYRQTIVFVVLDNEGRVQTVRQNLLKANSKCYPKRKVTKNEYICVWNKNIEFDNFTHNEIAKAMTTLSDNRHLFKDNDIADCENGFSAREGNSLEKLFNNMLGYDLSKPKLLEILFGFIISNPETERPVVQVIQEVINLAGKNHYRPVTMDIWQKNQESGFFGDPIV